MVMSSNISHLNTKTRYVIRAEALMIEERFEKKWVKGYGADATFNVVSRGWFVLFAGSREALYFGSVRPDFTSGDIIKITFEKE